MLCVTIILGIFCEVHCLDLVINSVRKKFLSLVHTSKQNFLAFLVLDGKAASFIAIISSSESVSRREAILATVPKQ